MHIRGRALRGQASERLSTHGRSDIQGTLRKGPGRGAGQAPRGPVWTRRFAFLLADTNDKFRPVRKSEHNNMEESYEHQHHFQTFQG